MKNVTGVLGAFGTVIVACALLKWAVGWNPIGDVAAAVDWTATRIPVVVAAVPRLIDYVFAALTP